MTLELATAFAGQLVTQLEPNVLKVQVAGEVRRKVEEVESIFRGAGGQEINTNYENTHCKKTSKTRKKAPLFTVKCTVKPNAKRGFGWATNPWVWALTFKRIV
jgi:hypothetical protein